MKNEGNNYPDEFGVKYILLSWKCIANDFNIVEIGLYFFIRELDVFHEMILYMFKQF